MHCHVLAICWVKMQIDLIDQMFHRVRVDLPTAVIRFKGLNASSQISVGSRSLPTLPNSVLNFGEVQNFWALNQQSCS